MRRLELFVVVVVICLAVGCTFNYRSSNLNTIQIGWTKSQFLQFWAGGKFVQPILRASQQQRDGQVVEVFTLPLMEPNYDTIDYWFVFKGGRLVQWGRPEDWQQVSGRYEIAFNPSASVR